MGACCARGCDELFDERLARRSAREYRRKGLDGTARALRDHLAGRRLAGATVLEVGGGVGALQLELLQAGAARALNLELSPAYETFASELAAERGLAERVQRRLHDLAADPEAIEPADVVVLHRVVCCYPEAGALLAAASGRARGALAFSHPRATWWTRVLVRLGNAWQRVRRRSFRAYVHDPVQMRAAVEAAGFRRVWRHEGFLWHAAAFERIG